MQMRLTESFVFPGITTIVKRKYVGRYRKPEGISDVEDSPAKKFRVNIGPDEPG